MTVCKTCGEDKPPSDFYANRRVCKECVRDGHLTKPDKCEVPGCDRSDVHGHHDDYSKPLEVRWLCPAHHAEECVLAGRARHGEAESAR